MSKSTFSPVTAVIDTVVTIAFFLYIYTVVAPHVPSNDSKMVMLFGASAAACMTGVFWLSWQMVKVVYRAQKAGRTGE